MPALKFLPGRRLRAARSRRGALLVEILSATLILVVLLGAIGVALSSSTNAYQQGIAGAELEGQARRMLDRIASELIDASRSSVALGPGGPNAASSIDYRRGEGFLGGVLQTGPLRRIQLVTMPGEANDGADNNGNGLIDECRLEFLPDVNGAPGQVVGWGGFLREYLEGEVPNVGDDNGNGLVDERGLCLSFDAVTAMLTIRLTLERRNPNGQWMTRTAQTAVRIRNE